MDLKVLVIGIIKKDGKILLRKKPEGSPPYKETWYLFRGEITGDISPEQSIQNQLEKQAGIKVHLVETLGWDTEIKADVDGITKHFIYLDCICEYTSGDLLTGKGIEKLEWVEMKDLEEYDHVPPSIKLFKKLGYL